MLRWHWLGEYGRLGSPSNHKSPTQLSHYNEVRGKEKEIVFSEPVGETHEESQPTDRFRKFVITTHPHTYTISEEVRSAHTRYQKARKEVVIKKTMTKIFNRMTST